MAVPASSAGKSAAAALEARTIRALQDAGFPLISTSDVANRRLPESLKAAQPNGMFRSCSNHMHSGRHPQAAEQTAGMHL